MEEKKELTIKQKKNKYKRNQILCNIGEYAVLPIPFVVMSIVNREEWFPNAEAGWKVGLGGALAIALMMFATFLVTKKRENTEMTDGYVSLMLGWALGAVIFTLIADHKCEQGVDVVVETGDRFII